MGSQRKERTMKAGQGATNVAAWARGSQALVRESSGPVGAPTRARLVMYELEHALGRIAELADDCARLTDELIGLSLDELMRGAELGALEEAVTRGNHR